jgi:hypothetical protein
MEIKKKKNPPPPKESYKFKVKIFKNFPLSVGHLLVHHFQQHFHSFVVQYSAMHFFLGGGCGHPILIKIHRV